MQLEDNCEGIRKSRLHGVCLWLPAVSEPSALLAIASSMTHTSEGAVNPMCMYVGDKRGLVFMGKCGTGKWLLSVNSAHVHSNKKLFG